LLILQFAYRMSICYPLCEESFAVNDLERLCLKDTQVGDLNRRVGVNEFIFVCYPILLCAK